MYHKLADSYSAKKDTSPVWYKVQIQTDLVIVPYAADSYSVKEERYIPSVVQIQTDLAILPHDGRSLSGEERTIHQLYSMVQKQTDIAIVPQDGRFLFSEERTIHQLHKFGTIANGQMLADSYSAKKEKYITSLVFFLGFHEIGITVFL